MTAESSPPPTSGDVWDVAIVGAGLGGATTAALLGRTGLRVVLIDQRATYPASFKAEKIEPDQAALFRKFGLLEGLLPMTGRVHTIATGRGRVLYRVEPVEQYGIFYQDMVNGVRAQIPEGVAWERDRVQSITPSASVSRITLLSGKSLNARLVVLACGTGGQLSVRLGIGKRMISETHSLSIGFNLERVDGNPFPFDALTYYPDSDQSRVACLSLFPMRTTMRANYFTYWIPGDAQANRFPKDPHGELLAVFPHLERFTGPFRVTGRIEMGPADLFHAEGHLQPGLVLLGDVFQGVCPTSGTGVSKVLTDVDVLCDLLPSWLKTPDMGTDKLLQFYLDPRKVQCDRGSLKGALYSKTFGIDPSIRWRIQRRLTYLWLYLTHAGTVLYSWASPFHKEMQSR